ncbi:MAG: hypothetical protein JWP34_3144 [Massilia sp.]|nr:hypothetical protein [Massilia sp.]
MISAKTLVAIGVAAVLAAGCTQQDNAAADAGVRKTGFPGVVTAGGGTSGEVIARAQKPSTDASYSGGTPYHAGGAGGNTGGTATAGAVQESGHGPSGKNTPPAAKTTPSGQ